MVALTSEHRRRRHADEPADGHGRTVPRQTPQWQGAFGADASPDQPGMQGDEAKAELREAIQRTMNSVLQELYDAAGLERERVYEPWWLGNATMLHRGSVLTRRHPMMPPHGLRNRSTFQHARWARHPPGGLRPTRHRCLTSGATSSPASSPPASPEDKYGFRRRRPNGEIVLALGQTRPLHGGAAARPSKSSGARMPPATVPRSATRRPHRAHAVQRTRLTAPADLALVPTSTKTVACPPGEAVRWTPATMSAPT